jgi:hypothetical protein
MTTRCLIAISLLPVCFAGSANTQQEWGARGTRYADNTHFEDDAVGDHSKGIDRPTGSNAYLHGMD